MTYGLHTILPFRRKRGRSFGRLVAGLALLCLCARLSQAQTQELLTNGGFETGDLTGWLFSDLPGSDPSGSFTIGTNTLDPSLTPPSPSTPFSQLPSVGAASGDFYAVSDSLGPGTHALLQNFTVPLGTTSLTLSFRMFVNDWFGAGPLNPNGPLDHDQHDTNGDLLPTQFARVDLLTGSAGDFDTTSGILTTFYLGVDADSPPNPYTAYLFDLSSLVAAGSTYRLRFAEVDNQFTLNQGVDDVSVLANVTAVPESQSLILLVTGLAGVAILSSVSGGQSRNAGGIGARAAGGLFQDD